MSLDFFSYDHQQLFQHGKALESVIHFANVLCHLELPIYNLNMNCSITVSPNIFDIKEIMK